MFNLDDAKPKNAKDWPHNQRYAGKCYCCGLDFFGPKSAGVCWQCYHPQGKEWWLIENNPTSKEGT